MITEQRLSYVSSRRKAARIHYEPTPLISTWLTARERSRVELLASLPEVRLNHHSNLASMMADLPNCNSSTVLISAALIAKRDLAVLSRLLRRFPEVSFVGLVMDVCDEKLTQGVLTMGLAGVSALVDGRLPNGQLELRTVLHPEHGPKPFTRRMLDEIALDLNISRYGSYEDEPEGRTGCFNFFAAVFSLKYRSVREIAASLGLSTSTLSSRFFRAQVPSPKRYLTHARLAWAAHLAEQRGRSGSEIALRVKASSPQSFSRTVRQVTGMTFSEFRVRADGTSMLHAFRESLIAPYVDKLRRFDPLKPV